MNGLSSYPERGGAGAVPRVFGDDKLAVVDLFAEYKSAHVVHSSRNAVNLVLNIGVLFALKYLNDICVKLAVDFTELFKERVLGEYSSWVAVLVIEAEDVRNDAPASARQ